MEAIQSRAITIRDAYYGGLLSWDDAITSLKHLICEFHPKGDGDLRRLEAGFIAVQYLEPHIPHE